MSSCSRGGEEKEAFVDLAGRVVEQALAEQFGIEFDQVGHLFAEAYELYGKIELLANGDDDPPLADPSNLASTIPVHGDLGENLLPG